MRPAFAPVLRRLPCVVLAVLSAGTAVGEPATRLDLTPKEWREDLASLTRELPRRHANAFHLASKADFALASSRLDSLIPGASSDRIVVGFMQLAAMIGDGHTHVVVPTEWGIYPIAFGWFEGQLRVALVGEAGLERALGARLVAVEDHPLNEVYPRVSTVVSQGESEGSSRLAFAGFLRVSNVLHGLGLAASADSVRFVVADSAGQRLSIVLRPKPSTAKVDWRSPAARPTLARQHSEEAFWFTLLPDSATVFLGFNRYPDLLEFRRRAGELLDFIDRHREVRRLVVDLRRNTGGDFTKTRRYLIPGLKERPRVSGRGRLYVLTGPATFSAAMTNAVDFRAQVGAILVGEPTGARPNGYQEGDEFNLPKSRLRVGYSTRYYRFQDEDTAGVQPDVPIKPAWENFRTGRDAALGWVLTQPLSDPE